METETFAKEEFERRIVWTGSIVMFPGSGGVPVEARVVVGDDGRVLTEYADKDGMGKDRWRPDGTDGQAIAILRAAVRGLTS